MTETRVPNVRKVIGFAAFVEIGAGLLLIIDPAIVVKLLLGLEVSSEGTLIGRCFGMAALALGLACWPGRHGAGGGSAAFRAILTYNVLIGLYLAYLGTVDHLRGLMLWPGVVLHAAVAFLLIWTRRTARQM
jgi:hypothetical protein